MDKNISFNASYEQLFVSMCFRKLRVFSVKSPTSDLTWNKGAKRIMANLERYVCRVY